MLTSTHISIFVVCSVVVGAFCFRAVCCYVLKASIAVNILLQKYDIVLCDFQHLAQPQCLPFVHSRLPPGVVTQTPHIALRSAEDRPPTPPTYVRAGPQPPRIIRPCSGPRARLIPLRDLQSPSMAFAFRAVDTGA